MVEIPVTTLPVLRVPIHMSYVLYLSTLSPRLARAYFATAQATCRMFGSAPSLLLHPLDFLSGEDIDALSFFPGMGLSAAHKRACVSSCLGLLASNFDVLPLEEHAEALRSGAQLRAQAA